MISETRLEDGSGTKGCGGCEAEVTEEIEIADCFRCPGIVFIILCPRCLTAIASKFMRLRLFRHFQFLKIDGLRRQPH